MSGFIRRRVLPSGAIRYYPTIVIHGAQKSLGGYSRKRDAEARLRIAEGELAAGAFNIETSTFGDFYNQWIESKSNLKPSTAHSYKLTFGRHILPRFGEMKIRDIRAIDVQSWVNNLSGDISPATTGKYYRYLRACLRQAEGWGVIDKHPCRSINLPRIDNPEIKFLRPAELSKVIDKAQEPERTLFITLAYSGLRLGEALALEKRHINFERYEIFVERTWSSIGGFTEPKTKGSKRAVPLFPTLAAFLIRHSAELNPDELLFSDDGEFPLDPESVRSEFSKALGRAELGHYTPHSLRHTFATTMLASGCSIKALQHHLGHSSPMMTLNTYSHYLSETSLEAVQKCDRLLSGKNADVLKFKRNNSGIYVACSASRPRYLEIACST